MADQTTSLAEVTGRGMMELRLRALSAENRRVIGDVLGAEPPAKPRTSTRVDERVILWLSIDQWLVTCPAGETGELLAALENALQGRDGVVINVSDARRIIRITGTGARLVLMKGTSTDLLHDDVKPGFVRRARFADLATLIHCTGEKPDDFELYIFRSYYGYVRRWLEQTSQATSLFELYGVQPVPAV